MNLGQKFLECLPFFALSLMIFMHSIPQKIIQAGLSSARAAACVFHTDIISYHWPGAVSNTHSACFTLLVELVTGLEGAPVLLADQLLGLLIAQVYVVVEIPAPEQVIMVPHLLVLKNNTTIFTYCSILVSQINVFKIALQTEIRFVLSVMKYS